MSSRHPGTTPETTGQAQVPGSAAEPGHGGIPGARPRAGRAQYWPPVLPMALLIILGLAGLRGAVTQPRWNGPLEHDSEVVGLTLEVILAVLLVISIRRRSAGLKARPVNAVAAKLSGVLIFVLGAGIAAVAGVMILRSRLALFSTGTPSSSLTPKPKATFPTRPALPQAQHHAAVHFPVAVLGYVLLMVVLLAGVVLSIWWARRLRPPVAPREDGFIAEDSEDLREAVESGRSALRAVDDARAAIIACYVAMEDSLAERGAAIQIADTPDELLARATGSGVVHGTAAARLTALFYEARFSSHPLNDGQRDAAEQALDELATALAGAKGSERSEPAGAQPSGAGA